MKTRLLHDFITEFETYVNQIFKTVDTSQPDHIEQLKAYYEKELAHTIDIYTWTQDNCWKLSRAVIGCEAFSNYSDAPFKDIYSMADAALRSYASEQYSLDDALAHLAAYKFAPNADTVETKEDKETNQ